MKFDTKRINIGLVGYGGMGRAHSYAYRNLPLYYENLPFNARLRGVCSAHLANAQKACADLGYEYATDDRVGKSLNFRAAYLHSGSVDPQRPLGWKLDQNIGGGGVLFDLGSHVLDLIFYLVGKYEKVLAKNTIAYTHRPDSTGKMQRIFAEDTALILAEMKCGCTGTIEATKMATGTNDELRVEIHGERGAIRFNLMDPNWLEFYDNIQPGQPLGGEKGFKKIECAQRYEKPGGVFPAAKASIGWIRGHVHSIYSFLNCIHEKTPAQPSLVDGAYIQSLMARCYESAASDRWIDCSGGS